GQPTTPGVQQVPWINIQAALAVQPTPQSAPGPSTQCVGTQSCGTSLVNRERSAPEFGRNMRSPRHAMERGADLRDCQLSPLRPVLDTKSALRTQKPAI